MAGRYDEWAAARTPALLQLAHALTGDLASAERALGLALARTREDWPRLERDDPDLEVRRVLVRSCGGRERAAAVLREAEQRTDAEIAEVLRCSEAAVRRQVARGTAVRPPGTPGVAPGRRAGLAVLERRRDDAEVGAGGEPPRRGAAVLAAVVAVVLLVGGVAFVVRQSRHPADVISYPSVVAPPTWRTESYAGVQVQVPVSWGWGGAPFRSDIFRGKDSLGSCGSGEAAVQSPDDSASYLSSATGFTGRPVMMSDLCMSWGSDGTVPTADALWFSSPLDVGLTRISGVVAETRAVGDQHVTVFSASAALRREILGTAREVGTDDNGCPTRPVLRPSQGKEPGHPDSISVCAYSQDSGSAVLLWSGTVPEVGAQQYVGAVRRAGAAPARCAPTPSGVWVALGVQEGGSTRWDLVDLACARIRGADGAQWPLTPTTVTEWGGGGVAAYVPQPQRGGRGLESYFHRAPG